MQTKKIIFGSFSERKLFHELERKWQEKFSIYHNQPFLNLIDFSPEDISGDDESLELDKISRSEYLYLKKTSVDFVICDKITDSVLFCIEFDGMSGGYNKGARYVEMKHDSSRAARMNLKCKCASLAKIPFIVLSYPEIDLLGLDMEFKVIDGIIGQMAAGRSAWEKVLRKIRSGEIHGKLDDQKQVDLIYLKENYEDNPILRSTVNLLNQLIRAGRHYHPEKIDQNYSRQYNEISATVARGEQVPYTANFKTWFGITQSQWEQGIIVGHLDETVVIGADGTQKVVSPESPELFNNPHRLGVKERLATSRGIVEGSAFVRTILPADVFSEPDWTKAIQIGNDLQVLPPFLGRCVDMREIAYRLAQTHAYKRFLKLYP